MVNFNFSAGVGVTFFGSAHGTGKSGWEYRRSWGVNWDDGKQGFGIYSTIFKGVGIKPQKTGSLSYRNGKFNMRYENDGAPFSSFISGGTDQNRTAAMQFGWGDFSLGFKIFTGVGYPKKVKSKKGFFGRLFSKVPIGVDGGYGANLPYGAAKEENPYRLGAAYFGYKGYQGGIDSYRYVGHPIQNIGAHYFASPQEGYAVYSNDITPYFQYQSYNRYTLW